MGITSNPGIMLFDNGSAPGSINEVMGENIVTGAFVVDYEQSRALRKE